MPIDLTPAWISLKITVTATIIIFFLGLLVAWKMANYTGKWHGLLDGILTLPLVLPPTVAGFIILVLIGKNGPIGKFFALFDVSLIFTWQAATIAAVVVAFPLMYKTAKGALEQIDTNVINVAKTLGASNARVFWRVALPMAWPGVLAATALAFARSLGEFGATLMVAGYIPGKTETIPTTIYYATQNGEMQTAAIWVAIIFVISLSVAVSTNYWNKAKSKKRAGAGRK
ncbi:MAG: molybdate ABC transporter permease subunit [Oscillospiraceae bacterium]|nr:molybdate ABC transporter permease subunit [Oscillospiraceae bacterium]